MNLFDVNLEAEKKPGELEYSNLALTRLLRRGLGVIAAIAIIGVAANAGGTIVQSVASHKSDSRISSAQNQIKGTLVGLCAIPNVNRVFVVNALRRLEKLGLHTDATPEQVQAAFKESYDELGLVDCKAILPARDRVKLCLQYPTTIPEHRSPTTQTTEYQPACETTR